MSALTKEKAYYMNILNEVLSDRNMKNVFNLLKIERALIIASLVK